MRRTLLLAALAAGTLLSSGCSVHPFDGERVADRGSPVAFEGFMRAYNGIDFPNFTVTLQAENVKTGQWENIGTATTQATSYTWGGEEWWQYSTSIVVPTKYWRHVPRTGTQPVLLPIGYVARVRAMAGAFGIPSMRADFAECLNSVTNGEELYDECLSYRSPVSHVYTEYYMEGQDVCNYFDNNPAPGHENYELNEMPSCVQGRVFDLIAGAFDYTFLVDHWRVEHLISAATSFNEPFKCDGDLADGEELYNCTPCDPAMEACFNDGDLIRIQPPGVDHNDFGGFLAGHRRYIRNMERRLMVHDYGWLPNGALPYWDTSRTLPAAFRGQKPPPAGEDCAPDSVETCRGWSDRPLGNVYFTEAPPSTVWPENVCQLASQEELHDEMSAWHANVHQGLGDITMTPYSSGGFGTHQSPSFPIFFPYHRYIDDLYQNFLDCP